MISKRIAYHEAGHALVAHALGFTVVEIIEHEENTGWKCGVECPSEPTQSEHFLMAAWALAGGAAEELIGIEPGDGCADDVQIACRHVHMWLGADEGDGPPEDMSGIKAGLKRARKLASSILAGSETDLARLVQLTTEHEGMTYERMRDFWGPR